MRVLHHRRFVSACVGLVFGLLSAAAAGAPEPPSPTHASPLTPEEQQKTFSAPPGFVVELVAAEPEGGKFVAITFDHAGRLWTCTALEYPVDANESPTDAKALFERGGRDKLLVIDTPTHPGRQPVRTFAEGLAIPLGVLPYQDGAFAQYGSEVRFYRDTNGDGRADGHEAVLTGFGIEDSHLFPHQFTRAPGGWILLAQGAFNYSKVRTRDGAITEFNKTKLARFRPDGSKFEIIGWGPCNIWGLEMNRAGEFFIQEANDQRWPMMPFLEGASYPLCGDDVPKPYAPPFPKLAKQDMGGTGLSGLALSEGGDSFPSPWRDVFFVANPITRKIQALRLQTTLGQPDPAQPFTDTAFPKWDLEHLPDFVLSSDPWFRPIAMAFGPDGCLYLVDWYNAIISHNEVPRTHPDRDKTRGRIWRVRHESQPHRTSVPDLYRAPDAALLTHLAATNSWEANAAWQEIMDRPATVLAPQLATVLTQNSAPVDLRLRAGWALEGLARLEASHWESFLQSGQPTLVREGLRLLRTATVDPARRVQVAEDHLSAKELGRDRRVTQEAIRLLGELLVLDPAAFGVVPPLKVRERAVDALVSHWYQLEQQQNRIPRSYHDDFETYLARSALERHPERVRAWLDDSSVGSVLPDANARLRYRAIGCLALGGVEGGQRLAPILASLNRPATEEEIVLVAKAVPDATALAALRRTLTNAATLRAIYQQRAQFTDTSALSPVLVEAARSLVAQNPSAANQDLLVQVATGFRLSGLEPELVAAVQAPGASLERQRAALRALREAGSKQVSVFAPFARSGDEIVRREAVTALAAAKSDDAVPALLEVWGTLPPQLRRVAVDRLASSPSSARQLVDKIREGAITRDELDGNALDKLAAVLPNDPDVNQLVTELRSGLTTVLRLNGGDGDYVDQPISLAGPFTVEAWVRLDPGIGNQDSLLGGPPLDANFYDSRFRVWLGVGVNDIVVANRRLVPDAWTHVAFSRDGEGIFRIFVNGELDATSATKDVRPYPNLFIGRGNVAGGTSGELAEVRVWNVCRTPDEIRAAANLSLPRSDGLVYSGTGDTWGRLSGDAKLERTADAPPVLSQAEAAGLAEKFARYRALAANSGDRTRGQHLFTTTCGICHTVQGVGGKLGPALDGAGAHGPEALLRNVLTPNAAMEGGYRLFQIETDDGEVFEGMLAAQDADSITLRQPNAEDQRFSRTKVRRAAFLKSSVMPEGLLEGLPPDQAQDLLAYVLTLK